MTNDGKFWLSFWTILGTIFIATISVGTYAGYLNDTRNLEYASEGLQPYTVTTCIDTAYHTEWHEAGWVDTRIIK